MIEALTSFLKDPSGNYSHARLIGILVALFACAVVVVLTYKSLMTETYFGLFLLYGTGHQTINKFLDIVGARFGFLQKEKKDDNDNP